MAAPLSRVLMPAVGAGASAVLFWCAQPPMGLGFLATIALVPWLLSLRGRTVGIGIASGFGLGFLTALLQCPWLPAIFRTLGSPPGHALVASGITFSWGALPWAGIGAGASAARWLPPGLQIPVFAVAVFFLDTGVLRAPGGLPWLLLGHTQWNVSGVAQLAVLGSVPLISAFLAAINLSISQALVSDRGVRRAAFCRSAGLVGSYVAVALLGVHVVDRVRAHAEPRGGEGIEILAIQPHLPVAERWVPSAQRTQLAILGRQTQRELDSLSRLPDLVVWPETVVTSPLDTDETLMEDLVRLVDGYGIPVILGAARSSRRGAAAPYRNSALWVEPGRGIVAEFDKTRAFPVVESARSFAGRRVLEWLLGVSTEMKFVEESRAETALDEGSKSFAVALCSEALYPGLVADRRRANSLAILNLANDSWVGSATPSSQQLAFATFRAIEQRLWLLRVAQGGVSSFVDPLGRIVDRSPFGRPASLRRTIRREPAPTRSEQLGLLGLLLGGGGAGLGLALPLMRRRS